MANNPFDQRIINQLERPTSSDLNIAQGQINANVRAFARQLLQSTQSAYESGVGPGGALGNSFIIRAAAAPSLTEVTMTRGVGFAAYANTAFNIGTITGLNTNLDYPVIYSQDRVLDLSGAPNPATPSTCRRDVIAIRAIGQSEQGLSDQGDTDIYEPLLEAFQSRSRFKTLTADLTGQNLTVLDDTQPTTQPIVCIKGAEALYSGPDSFLSAPITAATTNGYINIAVINRYDGQAAITESDIVDYRLVASPGGQLTITGSATVGATSSTTPGAALSNVVLKAPPGIKAAIYKLGANSATETNTYALIVAGPRTVSSASMTCTLGLPGGDVTDTLFPSQVVLGTQSRNLSADDATVTLLADPAKSSPVQTVAVGQPYHVFPFTVGTIENYVQSVTVPVTITGGGSITIEDPPGYPAMYPAGTYDVVGNNDTRTFYLNHSVPAVAPTTGLPALTYSLGASATSTAYTYTNNDLPDTETRIAGFVADSNFQIEDWATGIWKLTLNASTSATGYTYSLSVIKAKVFLYDNATNPESGTLIADSDEMLVPWGTSNASSLALTMRLPGTLTNDKRIYIALYGRSTAPAVTVALRVYFGSDNAAVLATNILAPTPSIIIPDSTTNYPAATYPVTGTTGTVTLDIPTGQPFFNPEATRFGTSGVSNLRTIPVNLTVTLNRS